jgi:hypothetical protein
MKALWSFLSKWLPWRRRREKIKRAYMDAWLGHFLSTRKDRFPEYEESDAGGPEPAVVP